MGTKKSNSGKVAINLDSLPGKFKSGDIKDLEVLNRIKGGEKSAFSIIYDKYFGYIQYYCYMKMRGDNNLAKDLTHEIMIKVYQNLDQYKVNYTFSSWVYRITKNYVVDYVRKEKKHLTDMNRSISIQNKVSSESDNVYELGIVGCDMLKNDSLDPEGGFIKNELRQTRVSILKEYLSRINEQDRLILLMYYYEDMSYDEIASKLKIGLSKMKVSLFRSKNKLKEMMSGLEGVVDIV